MHTTRLKRVGGSVMLTVPPALLNALSLGTDNEVGMVNTLEIVQEGVEARKTMRFADGSELEVDFIVFSTGIRPRDKLATQCGLDVGMHRHGRSWPDYSNLFLP